MLKNFSVFFSRIKNFLFLIFFVIVFSLSSSFLVEQVEADKFASHGNLDVYYLDVGQGDATLIATPQGQNILIDGGPDLSVLFALGTVMKFYDKKIDVLILTHPDRDHYFGLVEIVKRYKVDKVLLNTNDETSAAYQYFRKILADFNINIEVVGKGYSFHFQDVYFHILYPDIFDERVVVGDKNEYSLVIKIDYHNISFLFTGDLPISGEKKLIESGVNLHSQVVKAGHHGSRTSTSLDFLNAVGSKFVVISAGKNNRFGHPHYRVLKNIQKSGAHALRTDILGTIHFYSDGEIVAQE